MSAIKMNISGAEGLGDAFNIALEEVQKARSQGVVVEVAQDRSSVVAAIVLVASFAQPYVKEFVVKFLGRIAEHLAGMSADRAWAFVLHDVCGYSLDEVSNICGISAAAAQSRLVRGRRELHERVGADRQLAEILERGDR